MPNSSSRKKIAKSSKNREVVINACYGGFGLSRKAVLELRKLGNKYALQEVLAGEKWENGEVRSSWCDSYYLDDLARDDKDLVKVVKKLKGAASGEMAQLKVVKIPADVEWHIHEYDGSEYVAENHRTWC